MPTHDIAPYCFVFLADSRQDRGSFVDGIAPKSGGATTQCCRKVKGVLLWELSFSKDWWGAHACRKTGENW